MRSAVLKWVKGRLSLPMSGPPPKPLKLSTKKEHAFSSGAGEAREWSERPVSQDFEDSQRAGFCLFAHKELEELPCSRQGRAASAADLPEYERWCRAEASPPGGKTGGVEYNFSGPRLP